MNTSTKARLNSTVGSVSENYLEHTDGYVFKFDLKSGYHQVDV